MSISVRCFTLLVVVYLVLASETPGQTTKKLTETQVFAAVDEYFMRAAAHGFAGAVVVARDGKTILSKGYGEADWKTRTPATPTTAFDIASLDKQFIAAGILKLEEMGRLRTTDSVTRFFDFVPPDRADMTLHHLLSHTSGVPDVYWDEHPEMGHDRFVRFVLAEAKPVAKPGERWAYSNANYWVLERVIELASGMPYESFMRKYIFLPARMEFTGTTLPNWSSGQVSHPRIRSLGAWPVGPMDYGDLLVRPRPFRTLLSTAEDLFRWYRAIRSNRILSESSKRKWFTPVRAKYAYGWWVLPTGRGTTLIHHGGSGNGGGMRATFRYFPVEDLFFAILSSVADPSFESEIMGADVESLVFGGQVSLPPSTSAGELGTEGIEGWYRLPNGGVFQLSPASNGRLLLGTADAKAITLLRFPDLAANSADVAADGVFVGVLRGVAAGDFEPLRRSLMKNFEFEPYKKNKQDEWEALTRRYGSLTDFITVGSKTTDFLGTPETHSFVAGRFERGDVVFRAVKDSTDHLVFRALEPERGYERVLAPVGQREFSSWDYAMRTGYRVRIKAPAGEPVTLTLIGKYATVQAVRLPEVNTGR